MNFELQKGKLQDNSDELIVVGCFQEETPNLQQADGGKEIDKLFNGKLSQAIKHSKFTGKLLETQTFYSHGLVKAQNVLVIGFGEKEKLCLEALQLLAAQKFFASWSRSLRGC